MIYSSLLLFLVNGCASNPKQVTFSFLYNRFLAPAKEKTLKEEAWAEIQYYAKSKHRRALEHLDSPNEIDNYLYEFWKVFDPTPRTLTNEFRLEHLKRMKYVNAYYPDIRGWGASDRGRIYILYGPPEEVIRDLNIESELFKSIEVWQYNKPAGGNNVLPVMSFYIPGQMSFIFAETQYIGKYTQIFSTEDGEMCDPRILMFDPGRLGIIDGF